MEQKKEGGGKMEWRWGEVVRHSRSRIQRMQQAVERDWIRGQRAIRVRMPQAYFLDWFHQIATPIGRATINTSMYISRTRPLLSLSTIHDGRAMPYVATARSVSTGR